MPCDIWLLQLLLPGFTSWFTDESIPLQWQRLSRLSLHGRRTPSRASCCTPEQWTLISLSLFRGMFLKASYSRKSTRFRGFSASSTMQGGKITANSLPGTVKRSHGNSYGDISRKWMPCICRKIYFSVKLSPRDFQFPPFGSLPHERKNESVFIFIVSPSLGWQLVPASPASLQLTDRWVQSQSCSQSGSESILS